jgi:hypothetical protein
MSALTIRGGEKLNGAGSWTSEQVEILREHYPRLGLANTANMLGRSKPSIRAKASRLGIGLDRDSEFWMDFQRRAAASKVGRKRPDQATVMKQLHADGKLRKTPEQRLKIGDRMTRWIAENGHPRGALGMKHKKESLLLMGEKARMSWKKKTPAQRAAQKKKMLETRSRNGTLAPNTKRGSWKAAWRIIGDKRKFYRSRWEANYARFLQWRLERGEIAEWSHEPETFWFNGIKRGCVSYLPDFKVTLNDGLIEYHEVKGWMDASSKTKIKRMKKYHPKVTLIVIDSKAYLQLEKLLRHAIPDWE